MSEPLSLSLPARCGLTAISLTDDRQPNLQSEEELIASFNSIALVLGTLSQGDGRLFITNRKVIWAQSTDSAAYSVSFLSLIMHAVASSSEEFPHDNIYLQSEDAQPTAPDTEEPAPEIRLVPSDNTSVSAIFQALCDGAEANPDENLADDEGDFFYDQDEVARGAAENEMLNRFDAMLQVPSNGVHSETPQQFDDAESSSDEENGCPCHPRR